MSVQNKKWVVKNEKAEEPLYKRLFENRGLGSEEEVEAFMNIEESGGLHDPFLMKDMKKACDRILKAVDAGEKIMIFGDYDVDGITGAAILFQGLKRLGATVSYRIPHRVNDGYGLNMRFVEEFIEIGVDLVVTVDCGISCKDEVKRAAEGGVDVIITDHHNVPDEPPTDAVAIVHPLQKDCKYPFKGLTGAVVGFKVIEALAGLRLKDFEKEELIESLLDLASLGTVADCGPLVGENRYIVKRGLEVLSNSRWEGLRSLMKKSGIDEGQELDTTAIGFRIAPRINAAGRISNPLYALQLLLQEEGSDKINALAEKLESINQTRRDMLDRAMLDARENLDFEGEKLIIGWSEDWHVGILGLISGRMCNDFGLPAIMMQDKGDVLVGSARSNEYFNVVEALHEMSEFLGHYGGHHQAAGFNLKKENLENFVEGMKKYANEKLADVDMKPVLNLECAIKHEDVSWDTLGLLDQLGPYGVENEEPSFLLSGMKVKDVRTVGSDGKHLSISVDMGGNQIKGIAFGMGEYASYVREKGVVDIACRLQKNVWNGRESIQLMILDLR